jgi:SAM-dependent methyltransferase
MIHEWVTLLLLARRRFYSSDDYLQFQAYQGHLILRYLSEKDICIQGTDVLDLGSSIGGYGQALRSAGASVTSIDLKIPHIVPPDFILADAIQLPFSANCFQLVFCASLIEHVSKPIRLLSEIKRVLTKNGAAYLSFPPFYSPVGGHQFKPYHLLGERFALRLTRHQSESFATACGDWGLYPMTIRRARRLFVKAGLQIDDESTRFFPFNVASLPLIGEFLTWHVQFILRVKSLR